MYDGDSLHKHCLLPDTFMYMIIIEYCQQNFQCKFNKSLPPTRSLLPFPTGNESRNKHQNGDNYHVFLSLIKSHKLLHVTAKMIVLFVYNFPVCSLNSSCSVTA